MGFYTGLVLLAIAHIASGRRGTFDPNVDVDDVVDTWNEMANAFGERTVRLGPWSYGQPPNDIKWSEGEIFGLGSLRRTGDAQVVENDSFNVYANLTLGMLSAAFGRVELDDGKTTASSIFVIPEIFIQLNYSRSFQDIGEDCYFRITHMTMDFNGNMTVHSTDSRIKGINLDDPQIKFSLEFITFAFVNFYFQPVYEKRSCFSSIFKDIKQLGQLEYVMQNMLYTKK